MLCLFHAPVGLFVLAIAPSGLSLIDFPVLHNTDHSDCIPETPRISKQFDSLPCEPTRPQDKAYIWERIEAPLRPLRPWPECNFIHPRQLSPFPERLELPLSNDEILSGYEEIDRSLYCMGQDEPSRSLGTTYG